MAAPPTFEQIRRSVVECISKLMDRAGHAVQVAPGSDVISGLGLTSEDGVEFACMLEAMLKIRIPQDANPFIEESSGRPQSRTVQQVCTAVAGWAEKEGGE